jgi:hypothetical protein
MYRKTLIALACAVISAPAFAQYVPPLSERGSVTSYYLSLLP